MSKIIQQGAEAVISLEDGKILKNRVSKGYRLKELDEKIRKLRTRSEAKIIDKLGNVIPVPKIIESDEKEKTIFMEYIQGEKLSENLEDLEWKKICKGIGEIVSKLHNQDIVHGDLTTSNMIYVEDTNNKNKGNLQNKSENNSSSLSSETEGGKDVAIDTNIKGNLYTNKKSESKARESSPDVSNLSDTKKNKGEVRGKVYLIDFGLAFHSHKLEDKAVDLHLLKQALEAKHFKIADEAINIIFENYKAERGDEILEQLKKVESRGRYKDRH